VPSGPRLRATRTLDRLRRAFGTPPGRRRREPLDELVLTILSQNTSDRNSDRAFAALRARFPTWEEALAADRADLEEAIRPGGLARVKSRVIKDVLRRVRADQGRLSLAILKRLPLEEARRYLTGFRGVGEKTACCVLLFACGRPAFPVDTHIHRVARRLGWVPPGATPRDSHRILARLIPEGRYYAAHVNLITLGRRLCRPRRPACPACPARRLCRHAARTGS
jgi:endonuclease-3